MNVDQGGNLKGGDRAFSIAFGWGGLVVGGVLWVLWWGARHLPERGTAKEDWAPGLTPVDIVLIFVLPIACAVVAGRIGRKWMP